MTASPAKLSKIPTGPHSVVFTKPGTSQRSLRKKIPAARSDKPKPALHRQSQICLWLVGPSITLKQDQFRNATGTVASPMSNARGLPRPAWDGIFLEAGATNCCKWDKRHQGPFLSL